MVRLPIGTAYLKKAYRQYMYNAKRTGREFLLTYAQFKNIVIQNCYYCGDIPRVRTPMVSPTPIPTNGIDRVLQDKGYVLTNCVPCCPHCNKIKYVYSMKEFLQKVGRIYEKNKELIDSWREVEG